MPYFIFKVFSEKKFEHVDSFDAYKEARTQARAMRAELTPEDGYSVKIISARDPDQAIGLMSEEREPRPLGEE